MKNIELKVKLDDGDQIIQTLEKINAKFGGRLNQIDTYYNCQKGRLKLREINNKVFELIYYERPDKKNSKISNYQIVKIEKQRINFLKEILGKLFGKLVVVKKERKLWIHKNTRIHIDKVEKLGNFLELETVVKNLNDADKEHKEIIKLLQLSKFKKIEKSYSDLLLKFLK